MSDVTYYSIGSHSLFLYPYIFNVSFSKASYQSSHSLYCTASLYSAANTYTSYTNNSFSSDEEFFSDSEIYPTSIRYADVKSGVYVFERPPFQANIDFYSGRKHSGKKTTKYLDDLKIWIPWTIFVFKMNPSAFETSSSECYMFFNDKPLSSFDDIVTLPYTPNTFNNGRICFGLTGQKFDINFKNGNIPSTVSSFCNHLFNDYFNSWNYDLSLTTMQISLLHLYFEEKNIYSRIDKTNRKIPSVLKHSANLEQVYNGLDGHSGSSKTWVYILSLLSYLDFSETLDLISFLKSNSPHSTYQKNSQSLSEFISDYSKNVKKNFNHEAYQQCFSDSHQDSSATFANIISSSLSSSTQVWTDLFKKIVPTAANPLLKCEYRINFSNAPQKLELENFHPSKSIFTSVYNQFINDMNKAYSSCLSVYQNSKIEPYNNDQFSINGLDELLFSDKFLDLRNSFISTLRGICYMNSVITLDYEVLNANI